MVRLNNFFYNGGHMKTAAAAVIGIIFLAGTVCAAENIVLKDVKDKVSYSIGLDIGKNFKSQSVDIDTDIMVKGIKLRGLRL